MSCRKFVTLLDAYADGELEPEPVLEMEGHLAHCEGCSSRLQLEHATKKSLRQQVYAQSEPSDAFRQRVMASFQAEAERQAVSRLDPANRGGMLSWGSIVPLAAAAAMALVWSAKTEGNHPNAITEHPAQVAASTSPLSFDQVLDELVDRHIDRSSPEVTEPALLDGMESQVGVPVHYPSLKQFGARWEGGKVVPIKNQRAASLRFLVDGHRMTVYVYNADRFHVGDSFKRRVVRDEPVYTGWKRGFSIATTDRHGVGYAVATDLGEDEGAEIVASLH
ncbi:MAG TPA: zf-HC2 domain-containing protein [Polyangiaceae bacterium]|jgi:anti-sigma factor RsiW|nr:zf-HC2 domain-containing protein [Polyangiaceae bacterium]